MTPPRVDTSHVTSPSDPMTGAERDAIRVEFQEASESLAAFLAEHGDARQEWLEMFGTPLDTSSEHDAA